MRPTLNDALSLIQRAEASIAANKDDSSYCEIINDLIAAFKRKLSQDHSLPIEFFDPVDPVEVTETTSDDVPQPENPELTPEGMKLYDEIETSIGCLLSILIGSCLFSRAFFLCLKKPLD